PASRGLGWEPSSRRVHLLGEAAGTHLGGEIRRGGVENSASVRCGNAPLVAGGDVAAGDGGGLAGFHRCGGSHLGWHAEAGGAAVRRWG
ncbi:MAG: hypothetical protein ACP5H5_01135, partial [Pyrobaculum sp.]